MTLQDRIYKKVIIKKLNNSEYYDTLKNIYVKEDKIHFEYLIGVTSTHSIQSSFLPSFLSKELNIDIDIFRVENKENSKSYSVK